MTDIFNYKEYIKVIGFDLDQTLYPKSPEIDSAIQVYLYHKIADHLHIPLNEAEKRFKDLYREGSGLSGSQALKALDIPDSTNSVQEALEQADIGRFLKPNEEIRRLLLDIKERYYAIDLITGSNMKITSEKLGHLGIDPKIFNHIITDDHFSKSNSDAYRMWLKKYPDLAATEFIYIGDRPKTDHYIPQELGINTILVNQKQADPKIGSPQLPTLLDVRQLLL